MAKSSARSAKTEKKSSVRPSKTTAVEVVEEGSGDSGVDAMTAIVTALVLIAAIVMVDHELGALGAGLFFKG